MVDFRKAQEVGMLAGGKVESLIGVYEVKQIKDTYVVAQAVQMAVESLSSFLDPDIDEIYVIGRQEHAKVILQLVVTFKREGGK